MDILRLSRFGLQTMKRWDWRAIVVCALTAFTFWVFNALNAEHTSTIEVPLVLRYESNGQEIVAVKPPPEHINVNITGIGWTLFRKSIGIGMQPVEVYLTNPTAQTFLTSRTLRPYVDERLDDAKTINYIAEDTVFFDYDTLTAKSVPVYFDSMSIVLAENYRVVSTVSVQPDTVRFNGPASLLAQLGDTLFITLAPTPINKDFDENLAFSISDKKLVKSNVDQVRVKFAVRKFRNERSNVRVTMVNFPDDYSFTVYPEEGYLDYFIRDDLEVRPGDSVKIILDYKDLNKRDSTICPKTVLTSKMVDVIAKPEFFKITID